MTADERMDPGGSGEGIDGRTNPGRYGEGTDSGIPLKKGPSPDPSVLDISFRGRRMTAGRYGEGTDSGIPLKKGASPDLSVLDISFVPVSLSPYGGVE